MPGIRPDPTGKMVLDFLSAHADSEGIVDYGAPALAAVLNKPKGTVQNALVRLQKRDKIWLIEHGRYVVVDLID